MNNKIQKQIKKIPSKPGVYVFFAKDESLGVSDEKNAVGRILYIGKAVNLKNRVSSHFKNPSSPASSSTSRSGLIDQFQKKITAIDYMETENETQALILEDQLIKKYQPRFNIQQRDDKSYFWVNFTKDEWPRVQITHKPNFIRHLERSEGSKKDSSVFDLRMTNNPIGPFVNGTELKQTLRALRKILPYRTCKNSYEKPCLQWHIGLCPAHKPSSKSKNGYLDSLNALRQILQLYAGKKIRIEAYDISNIHGTSATGSMVVFAGNKPKKSDYRKFRIKTVLGANDVAMIKEVIRRRLNHKEWFFPDLILIDGGRGQINAAWRILDGQQQKTKPVAIISLAKQNEEIYTIYNNKTLRLNALPIGLRLVFQAIRNEAHRFAISYYRKLHRKRLKFNNENLKR